MSELVHILARVTADGTIPGISLATLRSGRIDVELHAGIRGAHDGAATDRATVFEAASLTKPLVAFIAMQLAEEGPLDMKRPLVDICGEYVADDNKAQQITAFHILTHTSGLPNLVSDEVPLRTYFPPGERFSYGSSSFAWLQRAMETLTGRPLQELACQRVFEPLGMQNSSLQ